MSRLFGAVVAALLAVSGLLGAPPAAAQDTGVTLQLLRQSPWSTEQHRSTLDIDLLATNASDRALTEMNLTVSFGPHFASQADFDSVLASGVTTEVASVSKDVRGEIPPGGSREIPITIDLGELDAIDPADSQTYPAVIRLLARSTVVASTLTPVIYLAHRPDVPMLSTTWVELEAPVAIGPDGALFDPAFQAALARGGSLRAPVDALAAALGQRHPHGAVDLVVDPLAVTQARDLADGYRLPDGTEVAPDQPTALQAGTFLTRLQQLLTGNDRIETVANPFADPQLPAMLASGLAPNLSAQRLAGGNVLSGVGADPTASVVRPADGQLSDQALEWLAGSHTEVVLARADTTDRSAAQGPYAPAPIVPMTTSAGTVQLVQPDPGTQALFEQPELLADPVRAAQVVLAQLAVIWKELPAPSAPEQRGIAIAPPATLPPAMWGPLLERLTNAPFLSPVRATDLVAGTNPRNANPDGTLTVSSDATFDEAYADEIVDLASNVEAYGSMLSDDSEVPTELRRKLFTATAPTFVAVPAAGEPWLGGVRDETSAAFAAMAPAVSRDFTFTSREGTIPVVMQDPGPTPLRVTIELQGKDFTFPDDPRTPADDNPRSVVVERPGNVENFDVVANAAGQNALIVIVRSPSGKQIARVPISVRSTAVNHVALLVTIAAAIGLFALYSRRWLRRRNPTP